jgi:hypothetical protein
MKTFGFILIVLLGLGALALSQSAFVVLQTEQAQLIRSDADRQGTN